MKDLIEKITSGETPTGIMAVAGILLLLLALKIFRGGRRLVFIALAVALFAGAVWWHFHVRGQ